MQQSIRLVNAGDEPFEHIYDGEMVRIAPGSELFVPFDVMVAFMGHPNLRNTDYENWRDEAYINLCLFYGALELESGPNPAKLPKLEAWDSEGNRISTIIDDPTGARLTVDTSQPHSDTAIMAQQLAAMAAAMKEAGIEVPAIDPAAPAPVTLPAGPITDEMPPADEPVKVKVGPSR